MDDDTQRVCHFDRDTRFFYKIKLSIKYASVKEKPSHKLPILRTVSQEKRMNHLMSVNYDGIM